MARYDLIAVYLMASQRNGTLWHNGSNTLWYAEVLIDPARGIELATHHMKPPRCRHARAKWNIGTPPCHVGRYRHLPRFTGAGHDGRFIRIETGVKNPVVNAGTHKPG